MTTNTQIDPVYIELGAKLGIPKSKVLPRIFQRLANVEQAKLLLALPSTPEELAGKLGLEKTTVDNHIQELFEKGVIVPGKHGWNMIPRWGMLHDSVGASNPKWEDDELYDLGPEMMRENLEVVGQRIAREKAAGQPSVIRTVMRVIPRWKSIQGIPGVLPYEDPLQILKNMQEIVVTRCPCKRMDRNRGCKDTVELESCINGGRIGQYNLKRGAGRKLSLDECLELLERLDEHIVVNMVELSSKMPEGMCNCHTCCCGMFKISKVTKSLANQLSFAKSRFMAEVDTSKCTACRTCADKRCPVGAIHMKFYPEYGEKRAFVDEKECIGCGLCVLTCPEKARKMKIVRPPEHIPEPARIGISDVLAGNEG